MFRSKCILPLSKTFDNTSTALGAVELVKNGVCDNFVVVIIPFSIELYSNTRFRIELIC